MRFLLLNQSAGFVGNSPMFWKIGGSGYTQWIDEAEQFSEDVANATAKSCEGSHRFKIVPLRVIEKLAKRTVDIQDLYRALK